MLPTDIRILLHHILVVAPAKLLLKHMDLRYHYSILDNDTDVLNNEVCYCHLWPSLPAIFNLGSHIYLFYFVDYEWSIRQCVYWYSSK